MAKDDRWVLDLEMMEEGVDTAFNVGDLLRDLSGEARCEGVPEGGDRSGVEFFCPYRFTGTWQALLEVATRYVEAEQNPEIWDVIQIVHGDTGQVHPLTRGRPDGEACDGQKFTTPVSDARYLELLISTTDEQTELLVDAASEIVRDALRGAKEEIERRFRQTGVRLVDRR